MTKKSSAASLVAEAQHSLVQLQSELRQIEQERKKIIASAIKEIEARKLKKLKHKITTL
ncbi:MAG: hypothetical protein Q7K39_01885 [Candidatus Magasanikbacteria bacterium]|nr:hypothetical protein [Candidatus Magasanikbacteria bacterium]